MSVFMEIIGNPFMKAVLGSPFHPLMSKNVALISVTGKTSGKVYTLPVNYQRDGNEIWNVSMRDRTWWKNLRDGAKVVLRLAGKEMEADGEVFEGKPEISQHLKEFIHRSPAYGKYLHVGLDAKGAPLQEDVERAAESRVMVRVMLS